VVSVTQAVVTSVRRGAAAARRVLEPWRALAEAARAWRGRRRALRAVRAVPDDAVTAAQTHGAGRLAEVWREGRGASLGVPGGWRARRRAGARVAAWAAIAVMVYATRHLLVGHFPLIGELGGWPSVGTFA